MFMAVTSDIDVLRDFHRERLDVQLALDERDDAALLGALGLADELDDDGRLDRLVEPHLAEVDVGDRAAHRILLVLGEDRRMHRLLTLEDDVEDGVQPRLPGHRPAQGALGHRDRARLAVPVEHAGNHALRAQAPRMARATLLALLNLELDSVAGHGGGL